MTDILVTRDGLIGNSPRYTGFTSPPYRRFLTDDSGAPINLTGVSPSSFGITMVNQSNPLLVKTGGGTWVILNATQGEISYQYASEDLADAGNWFTFISARLPNEATPRVFDPELLCIYMFPGGIPIVTIQDVNLTEVNGIQVSPSNPVPVSGAMSVPDGANVSQGATTDSSSASTQIGLLKAIKAYLAGTLNASTTETNSAAILANLNNVSSGVGSPSDATWSGSGSGSEIAILKKLVAELATTLNVTVAGALPAGSNLIGSVETITGASVALSSPPTNTNAGSDTVLTFTQKANHFLIQNNTSANIYIMIDAMSSTAGVLLMPGGIWRDDIPVTSPHIYTAAAQSINAANGILVEGWL